jgi:trimeric autotransporter adhesin
MKKQLISLLLLLWSVLTATTGYAQVDWHTTGNIVNPADFIGTNNAQPLNFKVGGVWAGSINGCGTTFIGVDAGNPNSDCSNTGIGHGVLTTVNPASMGNTGLGREALHGNSSGSYNTGLGAYSLMTNDTGTWNTAVGAFSLSNNNGVGNTGIGCVSLYNNTTGYLNTGLGTFTLNSNTTGYKNTAVGWGSLGTNATGFENVAVGCSTLCFNTNGRFNTATGTHSLKSNTIGERNTAVGWSSLENNTTGGYNTAIGSEAMKFNTVGASNIALGNNSLKSNTSGSYNVAIGEHALLSNTTANYNTALGWNTLSHNTTGSENTACGAWSLNSNTTGMGNAAFGQFSLNLNTTGVRNTALGWNTLSHNLTGYDNCSAGSFSLYFNTGGYRNVALGNYSMASNTLGWANASVGYQAAYNTTKGHGVVALGYRALLNNTLGNDNTALGNQAFLNGSQYNNSSAIGYLAQPQGSNEIVLGNGSITTLRCHTATITTGSDKRIKEQVKEDVPGLEFIEKLRPVTYNLNVDKLNEILGVKDSSDYPEKYNIEKRRITGFIAQEVEEAAKTSHYDFSGVDKPQEEGGLYGLRYSEFVVPLVKATQELNSLTTEQAQIIEAQKNTIEDLQKRLERIETMMEGHFEIAPEAVIKMGTTIDEASNSLGANFPNPFDGTTTIDYHITHYSTDAFIRVVTIEGDEVGAYRIEKAGDGKITIAGESLRSGVYFYELIVDGKLVASRKMVVQK